MDWTKFADVVKTIAPVVLAVVPGVPPILIPGIVSGIAAAQHLAGATGADKKAAVLAEVAIGLTVANELLAARHKKPIGDPAVIAASVGAGIDAVIATLYAIREAHATPPAVPVTP